MQATNYMYIDDLPFVNNKLWLSRCHFPNTDHITRNNLDCFCYLIIFFSVYLHNFFVELLV